MARDAFIGLNKGTRDSLCVLPGVTVMRALAFCLALLALPAMSADYESVNAAAALPHIVPAYEILSAATAVLAGQAASSCTDITPLQRDRRSAMTA